MGLSRSIKGSVIIVLTIIALIPSAFSWCVLGIGNTCGDDATEDHSILGSYFNFDKPRSYSDVCFFSSCNSKRFSSTPTDNKVSDKEGSVTDVVDDSGNRYEIKTTKRSTTRVSTSRGELAPALFYDVDIVNSEFKCINCPVINGREIKSAGFTYNIDLDLINDGNVETEKPIGLEIIIDTPEGKQEIIFNRNALIFPPGNYELSIPIESFGVEAGNLKDFYILTPGDERELDINVEVRVFDDYGVPEPRIQQITKTKRVCSGSGEFRSCEDIVTFEEKASCPDGSNYGGLYSCNNPDGTKGNELIRTYTIERVSPDVLGSSQFSFFKG